MLTTFTNDNGVLPANRVAARVWDSAGQNYDRISRQIADAIEHCVDRLEPTRDEAILDVATGTGWTARRIAARDAKVTGIDICSTALEAAQSLDPCGTIDFQLADAEALPFEDQEFDAVSSTFGVMFCGSPEKAAKELGRVCKPGGRLALAIWDTAGGVYEMFRIIARFKPTPRVQPPSPFEWAAEERLHQLLDDDFEIGIERAISFYREPTAEDAWDAFVTCYGPIKSLVATLDDARAADLRSKFIAYHRSFSTPLGILVPRNYLIVSGIRR